MKKLLFNAIAFSLLVMIFISCQKDNNINSHSEAELSTPLFNNNKTQQEPSISSPLNAAKQEFELKVKPLSSKQIQDIARKLQKKKKAISLTTNRMDVVEELPDGEVPITDDVEEIETILSPLVQNGRQIHNEILSKVTSSPDWLMLPFEEKNAILNLSDDQLGELSLIYSTVNLNEWESQPIEALRMDLGTIRSCLSGALGLGDLYYLIVENPRALLNASGAVKILKHVGLRYLGWVGLGLAVWDFVDCVS